MSRLNNKYLLNTFNMCALQICFFCVFTQSRALDDRTEKYRNNIVAQCCPMLPHRVHSHRLNLKCIAHRWLWDMFAFNCKYISTTTETRTFDANTSSAIQTPNNLVTGRAAWLVRWGGMMRPPGQDKGSRWRSSTRVPWAKITNTTFCPEHSSHASYLILTHALPVRFLPQHILYNLLVCVFGALEGSGTSR